MGRIQVLPEHVIAQIAAGEVIERPASVLKELLENSIDAGATRLDIEVGQGGIDYLRVVDDGCGIVREDLPLAFTTHATSKLRDAADLFRIGTLGFRGEGLASIGAVAQVTLQSRPQGEDKGSEIRCEGGRLSDMRVWGGAAGTRIEVRNLFFNTPVRRKFMRGAATEMSHVCEVFTRLALSQLSLHLTLKHNSRVVYDVPATAGLLDRIELFFGEPLRRKLISVQSEQEGLTLGGYIADPAHEAGGTQMQYLFINGRCVRDRVVSQALQEAYRGLLLTGKHAVAFLFLELPSDVVDVNVHPTKSEVRFRRPELVQGLVIEAVRQALKKEDLTMPLKVPEVSAPEPEQTALPFATDRSADVSPASRSAGVSPATRSTGGPPVGIGETIEMPTGETPVLRVAGETPALRSDSKPNVPVRHPNTAASRPAEKPVALPKPVASPPKPRPPRAIQMHDLYLIVEVPEGVLFIDQHALHERILYEQLKSRLASGKVEVQKLLIPEPIQLPPAQSALLLRHREALGELGLMLDDFGGGTVILTGYPSVLGRQPAREVLAAVVDQLGKLERAPSREVLINDLAALLACHSAVRAGDKLAPEEIDYLLEQRHIAEDSHHCPHGRPSSLLFTRNDLDRQFRRMG